MFPGEAHGSPDFLRPLAGVDETSGHEAALQLQRAILPTPLQRFSLGRYDLSVRYRPAESGNRVGGDWYDARLGPDGSAVVAIGDVAGHDLVAAAGMARIGNALLARPSGLLLGTVPTARYDLGEEELTAGDILFLYTDGLIERRDRDIDAGIMALLAAAGGEQGQTADEAIAALLDRLDPPVAEDDVCLLAVRVR